MGKPKHPRNGSLCRFAHTGLLACSLITYSMGGMLNKLLYHPPRPPTYEANEKIIWLKTAHGSDIPACYISQPGAKLTVLYSHGNAEDLGISIHWGADFGKRLGVNMFCYDY